jgi:uncharacterized membrane protein
MHPIIKSRFEQFSDGVFAIAITLLAIELKVPTLISTTIGDGIHELTALLPAIVTFVLSFVTIAIFWVNHHQLTQIFSHVKHRRILWLNVLFLMFLTLIPFATHAMSANPFHPLAMLTYSGIFLGASISFTCLRYFIHRDNGETTIPMGRSLVGPVFYLLASLCALYSVWICYFLLAIPALFYFLPKDHKLDEVLD